jgi:hypothetical protein
MIRRKNDTLCWSCKYATGGCSWTLDFTPVEGWTATKTTLASDNNESYKVQECPHYQFDKDEVIPKQIMSLLGIKEHVYYKLGTSEILSRLSDLGYIAKVTIDNKFIIQARPTEEVNIL